MTLVPDEMAAEVFALIVFLCDGLLQIKPASHPLAFAAADCFFAIAAKLPLELQMILCHRVVGSMKQSILHKESEVAFKSLATWLLDLLQSQSSFFPSETEHLKRLGQSTKLS